MRTSFQVTGKRTTHRKCMDEHACWANYNRKKPINKFYSLITIMKSMRLWKMERNCFFVPKLLFDKGKCNNFHRHFVRLSKQTIFCVVICVCASKTRNHSVNIECNHLSTRLQNFSNAVYLSLARLGLSYIFSYVTTHRHINHLITDCIRSSSLHESKCRAGNFTYCLLNIVSYIRVECMLLLWFFKGALHYIRTWNKRDLAAYKCMLIITK